ncbi:MAG TPA: hypothetical protein VII06_40580 [Chloroflexota bacterium]
MQLRKVVAAPLAALAMGAMLLAPHSAFADQRDFTLVNQTGRTITNAYVSSSANSNWGRDVLGRDVLLPGHSTGIEFTGGLSAQCLYDIRVVTRGGAEGTLYEVNLCATSTVTFN